MSPLIQAKNLFRPSCFGVNFETITNKSTIMFPKGSEKGDVCGHGSTNYVAEWELRPGGMLVQKRETGHVNQNSTSTIMVKVKFGSSYHEIRISSHASFGELKKMLTERTGLHALDQKLIFKNKERDSKSYLDIERVKGGSKLVLLEDIESRERRILQSLRDAKKEKISKSFIQINQEVDKLAMKVSALEAAAASTGEIITEKEIENLTENSMRILIIFDETYAEGELKLQKTEQVRRVQKHIETLDTLKMSRSVSKSKSNSIPLNNGHSVERERKVHNSGAQKKHMQGNKGEEQITNNEMKQPLKHSDSVVVITTKWETFD